MTTVYADLGAAQQRTWLVFALGPYVMCASALDVEGIIQCPEAIARLPLTPDYALGAFLFRGHSAAAISLRKKLKLRQGEDSATGPFIVARIGSAAVGFWVDEVKDVIGETDAEWRPLPPMLEGSLFERFAIRGGQLILQTNFAALRDARVEFESFAAQVAEHAGCELQEKEPEAEEKAIAGSGAPSGPPTEITTASVASAPPRPPMESFAPAVASAPARRIARPAPRAIPARAKHPVGAPPRIAAVRQHAGQQRRAYAAPAIIMTMPAFEPACPGGEADSSGKGSLRIAAAVVAIAGVAAILYAVLPAPSGNRAAPPLPASTVAAAEPTNGPRPIATPPLADLVITIEPRHGGPAIASKVRTYTVVRGDTLWQIARRQVGDPFRYPELAQLSSIRNPNLIYPGQTVRIEIRAPR